MDTRLTVIKAEPDGQATTICGGGGGGGPTAVSGTKRSDASSERLRLSPAFSPAAQRGRGGRHSGEECRG